MVQRPGCWQLSVDTDGVGLVEDPDWHDGGLHTIIGFFSCPLAWIEFDGCGSG